LVGIYFVIGVIFNSSETAGAAILPPNAVLALTKAAPASGDEGVTKQGE